MRSTNIVWTTALVAAAILLTAVLSTASLGAATGGGADKTQDKKTAQIARGEYLVEIMGCHDCHTPMKLGPNGPEQDRSRALSGHPEDAPVPPDADLPQGYLAMIGASFTSFKGPWGTSFTRNLTPDKDTGLGDWSQADIVKALQTGERPDGRILAPIMPWKSFAGMTKEDVNAIAIYLKSLPPVKNKVPGPFGPNEKPTTFVMKIVPPEAK